MTTKLLVLFFAPLLSGLLIFLVPKGKSTNFKLLLVFAGSYLFAITVIHILPELYRNSSALEFIGIFVLAGFFLQQLLEYFTSGIEHGHLHAAHIHQPHDIVDDRHSHTHSQEPVSALVLLLALCIHAFLEGSMLAQPASHDHAGYDFNAILLGIALHRAPAAFALMTVLTYSLGTKRKALPYLFIFSIAAPMGLLISSYLSDNNILSASALVYLYALVSGNFLHISTTIVFESSPEHRFNVRKLTVAIFGALVAIGVEIIL
ncbi:ZIP family metal transporter [Chryseosolibacter indicus]|uniref:ZIP family metal transporter n=1 Tax=Chryseosolibacter indicus TaxID=2782351 RepID=A0ABS5VS33_9BACT|nr:ZIP family metal transporter [Chryseosolibacter indicus]MBT1704250.1 ZIP family metal transporter [Chryseosolibacter indicus]